MANSTQSDIFKFLALRPPIVVNKGQQDAGFIVDKRNPNQTLVGKLVAGFDKKDGSKIPSELQEFIKSNGYELNSPQSKGDEALLQIYEYSKNVAGDVSNDSLRNEIELIVEKKLEDFLNDKKSVELSDGIWDRYYAFFMLTKTEIQNLENLTKNLRTFHLLSCLKDNTVDIKNIAILQNVLTAVPVVPKLFVDIPRPQVKTKKVEEDKSNDTNLNRYKELWNSFVNIHRTINDVKNIKVEEKLTSEAKNVSTLDKETGRTIKSKITILKNEPQMGKTAFNQLHANSKAVLKQSIDIDETNFQLLTAINQLNDKLTQIYSLMSSIDDPQFLRAMPEEAKVIPGTTSLLHFVNIHTRYLPFYPPAQQTSARGLIKPLGIGDLKVVKQKLKKYIAGEVAHIENVLKGETKERKHRMLDRTEDIYTISNETDEETTKDTQTTERFELKKESDKTIQEQMSVQAGVTVSGSYGAVTFGAHGDFAYSNSSQESSKNSSNFAREVIDKSVSKIQKRTKEERTTKKLHEIEEINKHGLNNVGGAEHITGIYRWVDKYYEAQIFNYGKRMMFEFIIPEPAAFFEYTQLNKPKKNITPPKQLNSNLTHKDINEWNYQSFIRDYNVQGITTPPPYNKICSLSIDQSAIENGKTSSKSNKELIVPEGYIGKYIGIGMSCIWENYPQFKLAIGDKVIDWLNNTHSRRAACWSNDFVRNFDSIVPVAVNSYDINSYEVNISVICERTTEKYETWQIQTFEKIMTAYKALQAEYEQKVSAQETEEGIAIHGQNSGINRDIEKTELKKHCVKMLMDTFIYGSFDAMKPANPPDANPPDFDIFDAINEGKTVQFFEQAFEWENITYLYYPYFWARKSEWMHKSTTYDSDPLFTKFLQAGSARVVIPVHPAYNNSVLHYLETGAIWNGGDAPRINDPLFISIHEELKNQTDDLANATPEGEPWEVVLPTTLVYLQKDSDLPSF